MSSDLIHSPGPKPRSECGLPDPYDTSLALGLHDLGNLLQIILACAEEGSEEGAPVARTQAALLTCQSAAQRAANLLGGISDRATGREEVREPPVEMTPEQVVEDAVGLMRATLPAGTEILVETDGGQLAPKIDGCLLHRAMINLLRNAIEALGPGGGVLVKMVLADPCRPRIEVIDDGVGMEPEVLSRATQPGFSLREGGRGFGLAFVREFAQASGGSFELSSQPDGGTTAVLHFAPDPQT